MHTKGILVYTKGILVYTKGILVSILRIPYDPYCSKQQRVKCTSMSRFAMNLNIPNLVVYDPCGDRCVRRNIIRDHMITSFEI